MSETLWIAAGFAVATAAVYGYVGHRIWGRDVPADAQLAADLFAVWWFALAGSTFVSGLQFALAAVGRISLPLAVAVTYLNLFLISVALWGLLYYLLYLYTGRRGLIVPLTVFYIAYYFALAYFVTSHDPTGVVVEGWSVTLDYRVPIEGDPLATVLLLLLVVPQIIGAFVYFLLFFRVEGVTQRFRVAVVSWSIIIWFSTALVGSIAGLSDTTWWPFMSRLIGLGAALAILMAYLPPRWIRERYGIRPIEATESEVKPSGG